MRFRKKPIIIEAIQWTGGNLPEICFFIGKSVIANRQNKFKIKTLDGEHIASLNDWIIKGVNGEFYPCKPDIFKKTYERIQEAI